MNDVITKNKIDRALSFYNINDIEYKEKCYQCIDELNNDSVQKNIANNLFNILYVDKTNRIRKLWKIKHNSELFYEIKNPYITNVLLLSGYEIHQMNMKNSKLDNEQIDLNKRRVRESLINDIEIRKYDGIRISQMLWGAYFVNVRIIEVGRLQYELIKHKPINENEKENCIKIHIPSGSKLEISKVKESIQQSVSKTKQYFGLENPEYFCDSWLLSKQVRQIVEEDSNIAKFYDLFDIIAEEDGTEDVLNFVFSLNECNDYSQLQENTSLQRKLKEMLLKDIKIKVGLGKLKNEVIEDKTENIRI